MQEQPTWREYASPGATLASGISAGFICGLLIAGVGSRLAMFVLRLTSDPALRGSQTDDGFTIGRFSTETIFLLGVTIGLGILGGLFYLIVRGWIPRTRRVLAMTAYFGLVGGASLISPDGIDFSELSPLPLAIAMFVAISAAYGAAMPWLAERMLLDGSAMRTRPWLWIVGLAPLVFANIIGLLVLAVAWVILMIGRNAPVTIAAWRSHTATLIGRAFLVATAAASAYKLVRDSVEILS